MDGAPYKSAKEGVGTLTSVSTFTKELSSMSYTRVDDVVQGIWQSGLRSMLAKIDIKKVGKPVVRSVQQALT